MKTLVAIFMGLFSGLLVYIMGALVFSDLTRGGPSSLFVLLTFFSGWGLTVYLLLKGAVSVSKVFSRGFLIGAAEWFVMILVGVIFASKRITDGDSPEAVGSAIGGGLFAMLTGGFSLFMAVVCLVGFAISYSLGREMKAEKIDTSSLVKCPSCAELIQKDAIKCRFCGETWATL